MHCQRDGERERDRERERERKREREREREKKKRQRHRHRHRQTDRDREMASELLNMLRRRTKRHPANDDATQLNRSPHKTEVMSQKSFFQSSLKEMETRVRRSVSPHHHHHHHHHHH